MDFHVESVKNVSSKFAISNTVPVLFMGFGAVRFFLAWSSPHTSFRSQFWMFCEHTQMHFMFNFLAMRLNNL